MALVGSLAVEAGKLPCRYLGLRSPTRATGAAGGARLRVGACRVLLAFYGVPILKIRIIIGTEEAQVKGSAVAYGTAHMHRWRHTVARLVALSVVGAPKVLFDLFGHKDIEMTLYYMMSDPTIADEALLVAKR
ncbi:hypothetical protein SAMN05216338_105715 [Bradyrhizobium sp. Rc2d]|uniref:hypothetical protein n=1 Tax=Bradyrhizobium sp. Rc2d TaxID=1855321 RepID=UPI00088463F6|nr:hypothetical protein [Bradyrhizobium sp. Rc2d]SDJ62871.1 hypothetical protein SAMN05216338_105715 [Bradyrhizobium sp. Rc2d]